MSRILLVEDDYYLAKNIRLLLEKEKYEPVTANTAELSRSMIDTMNIELCLIDVMLPDGNGFELCRYIRKRYKWPIIMISARDDEESIVMGLELGADDYVTKPFKPKELISRIRAHLRRTEINGNTTRYICGRLEVDADKRRVLKDKKELVLRNLEYRLLEIFIRNPEIVLKRETLLGKLWDCEGNYIEDNTLSVTVKRLREKIGADWDGNSYIETIRGVGYRWNASVSAY